MKYISVSRFSINKSLKGKESLFICSPPAYTTLIRLVTRNISKSIVENLRKPCKSIENFYEYICVLRVHENSKKLEKFCRTLKRFCRYAKVPKRAKIWCPFFSSIGKYGTFRIQFKNIKVLDYILKSAVCSDEIEEGRFWKVLFFFQNLASFERFSISTELFH